MALEAPSRDIIFVYIRSPLKTSDPISCRNIYVWKPGLSGSGYEHQLFLFIDKLGVHPKLKNKPPSYK